MDSVKQQREIRNLVDRALQEVDTSLDVDEAIAMLDRQMEELEMLEARIGKAVVSIDDLRGLFAARRMRARQR
jgi:hypothetical protein